MKAACVRIENFKGVKELEIDFTRGPDAAVLEEPRPLTCILGDNGSGKTSVLQAIALTMSLATRKTESADKFQWPGYLAHRLGSLGETQVQVHFRLSQREFELGSDLMIAGDPAVVQVPEYHGRLATRVGRYILVYVDGKLHKSGLSINQLFALAGRKALATRIATEPRFAPNLRYIGDVFWFDQNRNIANTSADTQPHAGNGSVHPGRGWSTGVGELRKTLMLDWIDHRSPHAADPKATFLGKVQEAMGRIFPGFEFYDAGRRAGSLGAGGEDVEILLRRNERIYELAEMSSGEQAVFPLVYEFVRQEIHNSVVLIDELELHLHPPQQQALLSALRKIGPDCQFIVTTHSDDVASGFLPHEIVRLQGGRLCL